MSSSDSEIQETKSDNFVYVVREDGEDVAAFLTQSSAQIFMINRANDFCSEMISSSYRCYKDVSDNGDEIIIMASHRFLGIIPYERIITVFECVKLPLNLSS